MTDEEAQALIEWIEDDFAISREEEARLRAWAETVDEHLGSYVKEALKEARFLD